MRLRIASIGGLAQPLQPLVFVCRLVAANPVDRAQRASGLDVAGRGSLADRLEQRLESETIKEVILATNPTTTGEATASHVADLLRGQTEVTRLAAGLPVGADLEHADEVTLGRAMLGRGAI